MLAGCTSLLLAPLPCTCCLQPSMTTSSPPHTQITKCTTNSSMNHSHEMLLACSYTHWCRVQQGHAAANMVGKKEGEKSIVMMCHVFCMHQCPVCINTQKDAILNTQEGAMHPCSRSGVAEEKKQSMICHVFCMHQCSEQVPFSHFSLCVHHQIPIVTSNRVGKETFKQSSITFFGGSFVCGPDGGIVSQVKLESYFL